MDGTNAYWTNAGGGSVMKGALAGGTTRRTRSIRVGEPAVAAVGGTPIGRQAAVGRASARGRHQRARQRRGRVRWLCGVSTVVANRRRRAPPDDLSATGARDAAERRLAARISGRNRRTLFVPSPQGRGVGYAAVLHDGARAHRTWSGADARAGRGRAGARRAFAARRRKPRSHCTKDRLLYLCSRCTAHLRCRSTCTQQKRFRDHKGAEGSASMPASIDPWPIHDWSTLRPSH